MKGDKCMRLQSYVVFLNPSTQGHIHITEYDGTVFFMMPEAAEFEFFMQAMIKAGFRVAGEMKTIVPD